MPLFIDDPDDLGTAATAVRDGLLVATAFGNFYAILAAPSLASMHAVNRAKGRPADQGAASPHRASRVLGGWDIGAGRDALPSADYCGRG